MIRNLLKSSRCLTTKYQRSISTTTRLNKTIIPSTLTPNLQCDSVVYYSSKSNETKTTEKETSIYGSIGDIETNKKQEVGPSMNPMSKEQFSKSLLLMRKSGTLSSVNMLAKMESEESTPVYGSLSPYALFESIEEVAGDIANEDKKEKVTVYNPIIALKKTSPHIKHFKHFSKVSLVVYPLTPVGRSPSEYDLPRVNFSGRVKKLIESDDLLLYNKAKRSYFEKHPNSKQLIESNNNGEDYDFYLMEISDIYYKERNSKLVSIPLQVFKSTRSDSITIQSREIIEKVNSEYQDSLSLIVEQYGDVKLDDCFMYLVDSFGLNCIGKKKDVDEWLDIRIPFDQKFDTIDNCKIGLLETLKSINNKIF